MFSLRTSSAEEEGSADSKTSPQDSKASISTETRAVVEESSADSKASPQDSKAANATETRAAEGSSADSKASPQDSKAEIATETRVVMCPTNECMSTPCDGGYGAILCVPYNAIYFDMDCSDHFTDLCIASSYVDDAMSMGAVCGHCSTDTLKLPCSSSSPILTKTYTRLDGLVITDIISTLAETTEDAVSTDQSLYNVTKELSSITIGNKTFYLDGDEDAIHVEIEDFDASMTAYSNGTVSISGGNEPGEFCFDYTTTSREVNTGDFVMLSMATKTGTHCVDIQPENAYTATVSEIKEHPEHKIDMAILRDVSDGNSTAGIGSIVKIILPSGPSGDTSEAIVPQEGDIIGLPHGSMTLDPGTGMVEYIPNAAALADLDAGGELLEYFDYVYVDQDGTSTMDRVTIKVVGDEGTAAATDVPTEGPTSTKAPQETIVEYYYTIETKPGTNPDDYIAAIEDALLDDVTREVTHASVGGFSTEPVDVELTECKSLRCVSLVWYFYRHVS